MGTQDILLDRDVRDWVLVPLTISIFLMMLIRQYATQVFIHLHKWKQVSARKSGNMFMSGTAAFNMRMYFQALMGGSSQQKVDMKEVREKQALARSQLLRQGYGFLPECAFRQRQKYFAAKVRGQVSYRSCVGCQSYLGDQCSKWMYEAMCVPTVGHWRVQPEVRAEDSSGADADQPRHDVRHDEAEPGRHHPAGGHSLHIKHDVITSHVWIAVKTI